jgi:hypothetical protein
MDTISYSYKLGVKEELVEALRVAFGPNYPDPTYAGKVHVVSEYPGTEVQYPLVVMRFNPSEVRNVGIGHYEFDPDYPGKEVLHWRFSGSVTFTVYALSPLDRDAIMSGLTNLFAFGKDIPVFENFQLQVRNQRFVTLVVMSDSFTEGSDMAMPPPWNPTSNEMIFSNSMTFQVWGEFFTAPTTGDLIEIDSVNVTPTILDSLP